MNGDSDKPIRDYNVRDLIVIFIYAITFAFAFFLMFLGVLHIFEVNDFFGNEAYSYVKDWCKPKGFFGWGYDCDNIGYAKSMGYNPPNQFPTLDFNYSLNYS